VLAVFDSVTPERIGWSDDVCTGLQVVEHLQDVGEDARRGRVYLPADDLDRAGCARADLLSPVATPELRTIVAQVSGRARELLRSGTPLARSLRGRPRWAVAAFTAGGLAALGAIAAADHDVVSRPVRPRRTDVIRHAVAIASGRSRR
jgi:phytoene/squalene synthetase